MQEQPKEQDRIPQFVTDELCRLFGDGCFGFAPVSGCEFPCVIVVLLPHSHRIERYEEAVFHMQMEEYYQTIMQKLHTLCVFLSDHGIANRIPPPAQRDEVDLVAEVSLKRAAVLAGLGFIGKNDLFICPQYGPRVRLGGLLVNLPIPASGCAQLPASPCGSCDLCVRACPYGCLTGKEWTPESLRADLIDYQLCNAMRKRFPGRKHTCGYCLLACPLY